MKKVAVAIAATDLGIEDSFKAFKLPQIILLVSWILPENLAKLWPEPRAISPVVPSNFEHPTKIAGSPFLRAYSMGPMFMELR